MAKTDADFGEGCERLKRLLSRSLISIQVRYIARLATIPVPINVCLSVVG